MKASADVRALAETKAQEAVAAQQAEALQKASDKKAAEDRAAEEARKKKKDEDRQATAATLSRPLTISQISNRLSRSPFNIKLSLLGKMVGTGEDNYGNDTSGELLILQLIGSSNKPRSFSVAVALQDGSTSNSDEIEKTRALLALFNPDAADYTKAHLEANPLILDGEVRSFGNDTVGYNVLPASDGTIVVCNIAFGN
jgi:hypothetical protein